MKDAMLIGDRADTIVARAVDLIGGARTVLEVGTRRWDPNFPTHHEAWAPNAVEYVKADVAEGVDVDVVVDAHTLPAEWTSRFDAVIAVSVFEHLARPWLAAAELARVLASDGAVYVATHQTFPLHGYPNDYFRFSTEGLSLLFTDAGLDQVAVGYEYPATIVPPPEVTRWNTAAPAYLNVAGVWRKP